MSECLSENEIVDFVMRNLEPEEAARAEAHIDTCSACRAVLIELARVFELRASSMPEPEQVSQDETETSEPGLGLLPPELLRGSKVGRYVMLDLLGTGAMGVVFAAYDPELDRRVALKLLRERTGDEQRNARMVREARATARLAHPNVVVVHDVGEFEGNVFMAMELVVGGTLGEWLGAVERSREAILDVFLEAGKGLVAAHAAGLVHRDFKPANVLMGEDERARVTDFGLARAGESAETITNQEFVTLSGSGDVAITRTGALVGTPAYMSPEQFEGRVADAQSDQFSYCVALAEALTGERPFAGRSLLELQTSVCAGKLRPSALESLPRPLQAALTRGLCVDPRARFPDMAALLRVVAEARRGKPRGAMMRASVLAVAVLGSAGVAWASSQVAVEAEPPTMCSGTGDTLEELWTTSRAHELEASLAGLDRAAAPRVARNVVSMLDTYAASWTEVHAETCEPGVRALEARYATLRCLELGRSEADALLVALSEPESGVLEYAEEAVANLPQPQGCRDPGWMDVRADPPEVLADDVAAQREALALAEAYLTTGQYDVAAERAAEVLEAADALGFEPLALEVRSVLAGAQLLQGDSEAAEATLRIAWSDSVRLGDPGWQVRIGSTMLDVVGNSEGGSREDGAFWADVAAAALERLDPQHPAGWDYWNARGNFDAYGGDYDASLQAFDAALAIPRLSTTQLISSSIGRVSMRGRLSNADRLPDVVSEGEALLELVRERLGSKHPRMIWAAQPVARALESLGRGEEALAIIEEAAEVANSFLEPDDPRIVGVLTTRAAAWVAVGKPGKARDDHRRIVAIREAAPSEDHTTLGLAYNNLAVSEMGLGNYAESVASQERALPHLEAAFGSEHINVANCRTSLASNLVKLGRHDEAREHLAAARLIAESAGPGAERLGPYISYNLALIEHHDGNLDEAARIADQAVESAEVLFGAKHPLVANMLSAHAKIALDQRRPDDALVSMDRALEIAKAPLLRASLFVLRARAHDALGNKNACAGDFKLAQDLDEGTSESPCE
ncbi:MAG: protein kinase domain-containing protein [Nannocystales bacterium]